MEYTCPQEWRRSRLLRYACVKPQRSTSRRPDGASNINSCGVLTNPNGYGLVAKAGTCVTYTTSSTLGSTSCTTTPQYTVYARAWV